MARNVIHERTMSHELELACWHTQGECWLKWDEEDAVASRHFRVNRRGEFPAEFRKHDNSAPPMVQWVSGTIALPID